MKANTAAGPPITAEFLPSNLVEQFRFFGGELALGQHPFLEEIGQTLNFGKHIAIKGRGRGEGGDFGQHFGKLRRLELCGRLLRARNR
jgi:hypothetical protein